MRLLPMRKISRHSKRLALFLTFCAGYVDAYTFIVRGNTLVAGQTGECGISISRNRSEKFG